MFFHILSFSFFFIVLVVLEGKVNSKRTGNHCAVSQLQNAIGSIGGVIELSSRIGREQRIAMEMAINDFFLDQRSNCSKLDLHLKDSRGNSARAVYGVMELMESKRVQAIIGTLTPQESMLVSEFDKATKDIPIISITPTATSLLPLLPPGTSSFIQMSNDITIHMQCVAAIVGYFRWRKVTVIYQHTNSFSANTGILTHLSDSLQLVDSVIEHHSAFPPMHSLSNPKPYIKEELEKLRSRNNGVFVLIQSSLDFAILLFEKANKMGLMGNGCVWIIGDDIASLLDTVGPSVMSNMQGVIGFRTNFVDTGESFRDFKRGFRRNYRSHYPREDEYSNPSIYALRAYDATLVTARSMQNSQGLSASMNLLESILGTHVKGLSGEISFKDGKLMQLPTFRIINVIGKSYREVAFWSPEFGFSAMKKMETGTTLEGELGTIYWPGSVKMVLTGFILGGKPLKIGVPARGAFDCFVKVTYNRDRNETLVTGFSIEVFEAAVKRLPYPLPYVFVPYYGSYDEMVAEVYNKSLDAAVGDTEIMADRYQLAEFSQPYMESGLVMVVTVRPDNTEGRFVFLNAFTTKMWVLMATMAIGTGSIVWLHEYVSNNEDFDASSLVECVGKMLWFTVTVMTFAQRELIKSNWSRLVLVAWFCVNMIVAACFTAELSSIMTVSRFQPTISDIELLRRTNAAVGCNGNSFIVRYLTNVLHFRPEQIRRIDSIKDYPLAFKNGEIAAAFFVAPHAKVFLAQYCQGYTMTGSTYKLGGFGFVFQKGSRLAEDISEAILKVTQSGQINEMEKRMLSFSNCSSSSASGPSGLPSGPGLDPGRLSGVFIISGTISALVFSITIARLVLESWIWSFVQSTLANRRIGNLILLFFSQLYKSNPIHEHPPQASCIELAQDLSA